jgi:hypothetical protein
MANKFDQSILQSNDLMGKRILSQYKDSEGNASQIVVEYDDLTDAQKSVFDEFEELSKSLIG